MKNFNNTLNDTMTTLSTLWTTQKEINENINHTKIRLFIDIEAVITNEALSIKEELQQEVGLNKIAVELLEKYELTLDSKKDVKKLDIVALLKFKFSMNIKFKIYDRINKKGEKLDMHIGLNTLKKLKKLSATKSSINTANKLFKATKVDGKKYLSALVKIIEKLEKDIVEAELKATLEAGIEKMSINSKNIEAIINTLTRKMRADSKK